ncbi:MAG: GNAT family N-acetyltransferase [Planctomycetota bacterium]
MDVLQLKENELDDHLALSIAKLACLSFSSSKTVEDRFEETKRSVDQADLNSTIRRFIILSDNRDVVAHAKTFVRTIHTEEGPLDILALASVCAAPEFRGRGLGVSVTRASFAQIDNVRWPDVCLFQTPVPAFYEKLNCRLINNPFVDRTNFQNPDAYPWLDDTIMIYPDSYQKWPSGLIDLNGPAY